MSSSNIQIAIITEVLVSMCIRPFTAKGRLENIRLRLTVSGCVTAGTTASLGYRRTWSTNVNSFLVFASFFVFHVKFTWLDEETTVNFVSSFWW